MGLKKKIADGMNTFFGQVIFVSLVAGTGGYICTDDSDKLDDAVSPYRTEALEKIEPIFASIAKSRNEIASNIAQDDLDNIGQILNPHNGVISDVARVNENLEQKISKNATGLASYIINSDVLNEADFTDLAERFNREGLSKYSNIKFEDNLDGTYRDECVLEKQNFQKGRDDEVLTCMHRSDKENYGYFLITIGSIWTLMFSFSIPATIAETKTLGKWRREEKPKNKLPRPDN